MARLWRRPRVTVCFTEQSQGLLDQLPRPAGHRDCRSTSRSSVWARSSGSTRAGCPSRTARSPNFNSRSKTLSTAQVARGAGQNPAAPPHCLPNDLHRNPRLARARRPVNEAHIPGREGELHRLPLHGVESGVQRPDRGIDADLGAGARPAARHARSPSGRPGPGRPVAGPAAAAGPRPRRTTGRSATPRALPSPRAAGPTPRRSTVRYARKPLRGTTARPWPHSVIERRGCRHRDASRATAPGHVCRVARCSGRPNRPARRRPPGPPAYCPIVGPPAATVAGPVRQPAGSRHGFPGRSSRDSR